MKPWPLAGRRALQAGHVCLSAAWFGAAVCLVLLAFPGPALIGEGLRGTTYCMTLIDDFVIIPTATLVVGTGVLYGLFTRWGFVRFHWVTVKWVSTLLFIGFGAFFLGPWIDSMHALVLEFGTAAFEDADYAAARSRVMIWGAVQTAALAALIFVSIFKPWGERAG